MDNTRSSGPVDVLAERAYLVIQLLRGTRGDRFAEESGALRCLRWKGDVVPSTVAAIRSSHPINWGGETVQSRDYKVLFDGLGWDGASAALANVGSAS